MSARDFLFQRFKAAGIPEHIIAGLLGNAQAESNFDPAAFNSTGGGQGALGIFQWRGPRQKALRDFAEGRGTSPIDLGTQADFFLNEIQGSEKSAWEKTLAASNPLDAFDAFRDHYERSGGTDGDRSGYARGRSFTGRIYREYTDPNYHFSTMDNAAAEAAKFPADPDPFAPSDPSFGGQDSTPPRANFFENTRGFPGNNMSQEMRAAVNTAQAGQISYQPAVPHASPSSLINADPARGDSFPYVTGADLQPNGQIAPGILNPYMAGVAPVSPASPEAAPTIGNAVAELSSHPLGPNGAPAASGMLDQSPGRVASAPLGLLSAGVTPEGISTGPARLPSPEVSSGLMSPTRVRGEISAPTAPEPNPGDEKDPWNWKLSLFEGLEGLGVGLGQMSHGTDINIGGVRERINRRKAGEAANEINQTNAETARMQENRLASAPKAQPINRQAVAQMAAAANDTTAATAIMADPSGKVAEQYLSTAFSGDKPLNRAAIAELAQASGATPAEVGGILSSDEVAKQYASSLFPDQTADSKPIADPQLWADTIRAQAADEEDPQIAKAMNRSANAMELAALTGGDTASVADSFGQLMSNLAQTSAQTAGSMTLAEHSAGIEASVLSDAREFEQSATELERAEAMVAASKVFAGRGDIDELMEVARTQGLEAARAVAADRDSAAETQDTRDGMAEYIKEVYGNDHAANLARTSATAGLEEAQRVQAVQEAARKEGETNAKQEQYVDYMTKAGHADVAALIRAGENEKAADLYMQKTDEPDLPSDIRTLQWLMDNDLDGQATELAIKLRTASSDKIDPREKAIMQTEAEAISAANTELEGLRELVSKSTQAAQIVSSPEFTTGKAQQLLLPVQSFLDSIGVKIGDVVEEREVLKSIGKGLIPLLRGTGGGAMSDKDSDNIEASFASVGNTRLANKAILQFVLHRSAVRKTEINADRDNFIQGGDLDSKSKEAFVKARLTEAALPNSPFAIAPEGASFPDYMLMLYSQGRLKDGDVVIKPGGGFVEFNVKLMREDAVNARGK